MLSSCQQIVDEQMQDFVCQWVADYAEDGVDPDTGLAYNRVVEVYEFFEKNVGYYECYLLNGDELVNAEYVRGENGDIHYDVDGAIDLRSTMRQRKLDVCLDVWVFPIEEFGLVTLRYDDGLITDGDHIFTPATEAQREQILKWYESRHNAGLAEKLLGKWIQAETNGEPTLTNKKTVTTFYSTGLATISTSRETRSATMIWSNSQEYEVDIDGNKVTLTREVDANITLINEYIITDINDDEMVCNFRHITIRNGEKRDPHEQFVRFKRVEADYSDAIVGLWEGHCTSEGSAFDDGQAHRWKYKNNGDFVYYVQNSAGEWVPGDNTLNEYFVDGNLLCTRWVDNGVEYREWWEIASISGDQMNWTALRQDNPDGTPYTVTFEMKRVPGIAMIVKNGQIDYFRQIETSFRSSCQEKGLEAFYYSTSSETDYQEQLAAVAELRKLEKSALKGIIFAPSYGINGENAEAEVAALAKERGIPVIILDSPVKTNGPLATCPYIGTDNTAAGEAMAEKVAADKVAVFAMINSPGIERAEAFQVLKPNADVFRVGDTCNDEVEAVLNEYDDFVFFNGNTLIGVLPTLVAAGKRVYTFDVYAEFLDLLIADSPSLKGVMAQNTFAMARKAVEAVLAANGKPGEMVPTFYITADNLDAEEVQPFLEFYNKK
jgi:ABC-type sugar transport system substrate-binding protein